MSPGFCLMKDHHLLFHFFFLFFIFNTVADNPDVNIAVVCGFSGNTTFPDGRVWNGDFKSEFSPSEPATGIQSMNFTIPINAVNYTPYSTARLSRSQFTYTFNVTAGPKFIRLHFLPERYSDFFKATASFTVKSAQFTLLETFSDALTANFSHQTIVYREFCISVEKSGKLNITFIPSPNSYAFVNGIEVVSMPSTLYYVSDGVGNNTALELYHRLNIGGDEILPGQDSGMYRTWTNNEWYIDSGIGISISNYTFPINYTAATPNYTATDKVYQSAISMGKDQNYSTLRNLTWNLPVHGGFSYLVRLHFCQIQVAPFYVNESEMHFAVYINKLKQNGTVDLVTLGSPVYKDYVVMVDKQTPNISVDLEPLKNETWDAILNGIEVFKLNKNYILPVPNPPPPRVGGVDAEKKPIIAAVVSSVGLSILLSLVGLVVLWKLSEKKRKRRKKKKRTKSSLLSEQRCQCFTFEEILEATEYFKKEREIGAGGFGAVYKGIFENEDLTVAIKRLKPDSRQGEQEFMMEMELLSEVHHYNIVKLIGYCIEGKERVLVYEFMENGTLKDHLYDTTNTPLTWKTRLEVCHGAACGLNYLHRGTEKTIIHRDVKTTNILLDPNMMAKVSDFGMCRTGPNDTPISTAVKGTPGYLDPEYYHRFQVTEKSDVYSFGVVLFEVLCARKPLDPTRGDQQVKMTLWARRCIEEGNVHKIIDPNLKGKISPECLKQFLELATSCISDKMKDRPTMAVVEEKLMFILQLQEAADAMEMEKHPDGNFAYPEEQLPATVASLRSESYMSHVANVLSGNDISASTMKSEDLFQSVESSGNAISSFQDSMKS